MNIQKKKDVRNLVLLLIATVIFISIFLFWGLNAKNVNYYLPKRFYKVLTILIVSYCVGYSSVTFQTVTNNIILTPSVMGLDSLYMFIQTVVIFFFGSKTLSMMTGYTNFIISVLAMVLCSCLLFLFLFRGKSKSLYFIVLAGMIIGSLFSGLATFMQVLLDPNEFLILQNKMFASFSKINTNLLGISMVLILAIFLLTLRDYKIMDVIALGPDHAINLGVPYQRAVLKSLIVTAILVSISTALIGPITFLGILVVSLARKVVASYHHTTRIFAAWLIGCLALSIGLLLVERVFQFAATISMIINFIGGICFIYLLLKESKK